MTRRLLQVGYISSPDGDATRGDPNRADERDVAQRHRADVAGPDGQRSHLTSISGGTATTVFAVGVRQNGMTFDEGMYAPSARLPIVSAAQANRPAATTGAGPITGPVSRRHAPRSEKRLIRCGTGALPMRAAASA